MATQTPAPQRWPEAHCVSVTHAQKPPVHCPLEPHCESMTQVPHVPCTHACPPSHGLFEVQAAHAPLRQTSPLGVEPIPMREDALQSLFDVHVVHTPARHVCPLAQSVAL